MTILERIEPMELRFGQRHWRGPPSTEAFLLVQHLQEFLDPLKRIFNPLAAKNHAIAVALR